MLQQLGRRSGSDEAGNVDVDKCGHQELAVESVHDASVSGDHVSEILKSDASMKRPDEWHSKAETTDLDFECSLEPRSEESSERSNDRAEDAHRERVQEERVHRQRSPEASLQSNRELITVPCARMLRLTK